MSATLNEDVQHWSRMRVALDQTREQLASLEQTPAVAAFQGQLKLLEHRLTSDPRTFRELFISEGMAAVAAQFRGGEPLSAEFTVKLWDVLLRGDAAASALMRFIWLLPLKGKRVFVAALDEHLSERYPIFKGLSVGWPASVAIPPYIREPADRNADFDLVNTGYLGYIAAGYSLREVELIVWLEALRDKQCNDAPCELGVMLEGHRERKGGCPVQIHIPTMFDLIGLGKFREALQMLESCNPLPNVTGRVCPQELQCQGVCMHKHSMTIGQVEWFLPEWDKRANPGRALAGLEGTPDPWEQGIKPPVAVVGSGPSGLISAYLMARAGFPVTVFEAFHSLGGVLRYGIPEFRLPNNLIDDVVAKIKLLGGRFVTSFVVGKTATLQDLRNAGFQKIFVGSGAGLPKFLNVPGEHLLNVMSANEFLTRVNLMQGHDSAYETPLPEVTGKQVLVIGGGNTAMDAARTARRLGGNVTIVYRRTRSEMPARVEELEHALEEGIALQVLRSPREFFPEGDSGFVAGAILEVMALGEPDASGRRSPKATGETQEVSADLVIMALGNSANPIIKDSTPDMPVSKWGTIELPTDGSQETGLAGIFTGGDAARGGSTAIRAAGDGRAAALEIVQAPDMDADQIRGAVAAALAYTKEAEAAPVILAKRVLSHNITEFVISAPAIAKSAQAGQFVRVLATEKGELIPLTLADWDAAAGTITLAVQGMGTSSLLINKMNVGERFVGIAGPLGLPSELHKYALDTTVVFTAGGLGLPPVYPIMREHLRLGNHVTLISGFRNKDLMFWTDPGERVPELQREFGDLLDVIYTTDDGSYGVHGFVTTALQPMLDATRDAMASRDGAESRNDTVLRDSTTPRDGAESCDGEALRDDTALRDATALRNGTAPRKVAEVVTIGPPMMMRAVSDLTKGYGVKTVASLNSIMVDATGMCGACMVPVLIDGKLIRKHACIDGPEIDAHSIDWDKFLPRFRLFKAQEAASRTAHNL